MSNTSTSENSLSSNTCAHCGKEGSEVTNTCNKCKSVMYCNAACKKRHRHLHKKVCEEYAQRAAELYDDMLFKQPTPKKDCPICMLRLPTISTGSLYKPCCGKLICKGCIYAVQETVEGGDDICPFCKTPASSDNEWVNKRLNERMDINDPRAIYNLGVNYYHGLYGLPQNYAKALELLLRAGELGCADAYGKTGVAYKNGEGVDVDLKKAEHYFELAAMGGDSFARNNLGVMEGELGNYDRAMKHWMIAVRDGDDKALQNITILYSKGHATKDDHAKALRSYQACLDEIRSDQRDEAAAASGDKYYESSAV